MNGKCKKNIALIIFEIILMVINSGCTLNNKIEKISKKIELTSGNCIIEKDNDSHGGFLGDGEYFAKIICKEICYDKLSNNWKMLPLTKSLFDATKMINCDSKECKSIYERYAIPKIISGYYYFLDRHINSFNKYDDTDINNRSSYNFTLAFLDKDTNTIYYYELDT